MKRKKPDTATPAESATPKRRRTTAQVNGHANDQSHGYEATADVTPSKSAKRKQGQGPGKPTANGTAFEERSQHEQDGNDADSGSPTPRANCLSLHATPRQSEKSTQMTPTKAKKADSSAKKKSARTLLNQDEEDDDWEGQSSLAREILDDDDVDDGDGETVTVTIQPAAAADGDLLAEVATNETPSRKRGRPKGSKTRRSPTPEGDLPPEERFFFQNRPGPPNLSNNTLASMKLLTHDQYFEQIRKYQDHHDREKVYLMKLHARSFPQWRFELSQGFNICIYGWGSKRKLSNRFAEWLHAQSTPSPTIVVVNGYTPKLNVRNVLATLATAVTGGEDSLRLVGQPQEMLDTLLSYLTANPPARPVLIIINSIDSQSLRRSATQSLLARLAAYQHINLIATADTPSYALLWNSTLKCQLNFVFHDCTTYAPYDVELSVVDDVHELLGRKGHRIGGKEGIGFVLKSLPENARNLYRVLLTELLAILTDDLDGMGLEDMDEDEIELPRRRQDKEEEIGVEYRSLYQKASEEFICSSDMNFRFLLKEFHDHQMITSRRDASGTELLGVPLGREDMEGVLEDLILA